MGVLGTTGRNVGAGMTGGIAYFYDEDGSFPDKVNKEIVKMQRVQTTDGANQLKTMIEKHFQRSGGEKAEKILDDWEEELSKFGRFILHPKPKVRLSRLNWKE